MISSRRPPTFMPGIPVTQPVITLPLVNAVVNVWRRFHESEPEGRGGNPEDHVAIGELLREVRLIERAPWSVSATFDRIQVVNPAIRNAELPGYHDETSFAHGTGGGDK